MSIYSYLFSSYPLPSTIFSQTEYIRLKDRTIIDVLMEDENKYLLLTKYFVSHVINLLRNELFECLGSTNTGARLVDHENSYTYKEVMNRLNEGKLNST